MAKAELEAAIAELGLTMTVEFVPWSRSRNFVQGAGPDKRSLNWKVTISRTVAVPATRPRETYNPATEAPIMATERWIDPATGQQATDPHTITILTTDYGAGVAHCPSYKQGARWTLDYAAGIEYETETGKGRNSGRPILPDACDVISSLVLDASVLDSSSFEDWASEFGMDPDSRKAEAIYRACLEIALKLRNGIGEAGLAKLREAAQDY